MDTPEIVTEDDIAAGLKALGLGAGDRIMVHSSLSAFGRVEGGPAAVCRALQRTVTPAGTAMLPSFNHAKIFYKGTEVDPGACFDPRTSPTTNGAIPEAFRQMEGVRRSLNPTHSFAAWGRDAERYTAGHHRTLTMGADSPLGLLEKDGGKIVLLGVSYGPNTFRHVIEQTNDVPCLAPRADAHRVRLADGRVVEGRTWGWRAGSCPIGRAGVDAAVELEMDRRGLASKKYIGRGQVIVFRMTDFREVYGAILQNGLGSAVPCRQCSMRPGRTPFTVESDWDVERGCLKQLSESLMF